MSWRRSVNDVVEAIRAADGQCVILIGAGCSKSAGIPLAGALMREIEQTFPSAYARASDQKNYNKLMSTLTTQQRRQLLQGHIEKAKINWAHLALAQMFKNQLVDRVLTVNFDPLVVRACAIVGLYPAIYDLATAHRFRSAAIAPQSVFYLNGQHTGFVLLNTADELEAHRARLKEIVADTGTRRTWLIVGYSGEADPLLEILAEQNCFEGGLFWVGHDPEPSEAMKSQLLESLEAKDAFYVGGQDADRFFVELAQKLDAFPPDILADPIAHLRAMVAHIDFETGGGLGKSLGDDLQKKLDACSTVSGFSHSVVSHSSPAAKVAPSKWLLAGDNQRVLDWFTSLSAPTDKDRAFAAWAFIQQGVGVAEEAITLKNTNLADARGLWALTGEKYQAALAIKPDMHEALYNWGVALVAEAQSLKESEPAEARRLWAQAGEKYRAVLAIKPEMHEALHNWGGALASEAQVCKESEPAEARRLWADARGKFKAELAVKPDKHEALEQWGSALASEAEVLKGSDLAEARRLWALAGEKYQAALAIKPDMHEALHNWGVALAVEAQALKDSEPTEACRLSEEAKEKLLAALAIKPDMYEALNHLAAVYANQWNAETDVEQRVELFAAMRGFSEQAEKIKVGSGSYNLACSYAMEKNVQKCLCWLDIARQHGVLPNASHLRNDLDLSGVRNDPAFITWWEKCFPGVPIIQE
jgi:hypothetical protein